MAVSYDLLRRQLERADESLTQPELPAALRSLHAARVAGPAAAYRAAYDALVRAEDAAAKERREMREAVTGIAAAYRFTRALVAGHQPDLVLPDSLTKLTTDTDRKLAIESLLHRIESNAGTAWADELAQTEFATKAAAVVQEIHEDITARASLSKAVEARAVAFGPAYEAMIAYRIAVRAGVGSASPIYRRLTSPDRAAARDAESPSAPANGAG